MPANHAPPLSPGEPVKLDGKEIVVEKGKVAFITVNCDDAEWAAEIAEEEEWDSLTNVFIAEGVKEEIKAKWGLRTVPHYTLIGADGTLSIVPQGAADGTLVQLDRLQVSAIYGGDIRRRDDGLLRLREGGEAVPAAGEVLATGSIEGANVNTAESLVKMIELSRAFELNVKLMQSIDRNAEAGSRLIRRG